MQRAVFAAAILLSAGAVAQTGQTTTNCTSTTWGSINCTTQPSGINPGLIQSNPNYAKDAMDGYERGVRIRQQQELVRQQAELSKQQAEMAQQEALLAQQQAEALAAQQRANELHKAQSLEAAKIVTAGDCPGAERYALEVGNLTLAKQVKDYCAK